MTDTALKLKKMLCSIAVMLAFAVSIAVIPAYAASPGIYTATAVSHYRHPSTGVIEDSGGESSYVLGQSMTDSALNPNALVEVDSSGATWITIRLNLMDNIQSPQFQVDGSPVSAALMQEDYSNNTADFRMRANSENSVIRCNMYVIPMGREVIFYITVGGLSAGSGDFVTSITVEAQTVPSETAPPQTTASQAPAPETIPVPETTAAQTAPSVPEGTTAESTSSEAESPSENREEEETEAVPGLAEFDASGSEADSTASPVENGAGTGDPVIWWVTGGVAAAAAAGGCVWYFGFFRRRRKR